jgi:hypothetical protein
MVGAGGCVRERAAETDCVAGVLGLELRNRLGSKSPRGETEHSTGVKSGTIKIDASADAPLLDAEVRKLGDSLPRQAAGVEGEGRHDGRPWW